MDEEREFTEAELTGEPSEPEKAAETPPGEETPAPPTEPEPKEPETPAEQEAELAEEKKGQQPAETPPEKIPEGYVKQEALRQERSMRQKYQRELAELRKEKEETEAGKPPEPSAKDLILTDPEASIEKLVAEINELRHEISRRDFKQQLEEKIPNFEELAPQMEEYLTDRGFSDDDISALIGSAGPRATELFLVLGDALKGRSGEGKTPEQIEKEITPRIVEQVTRQLMEKFQIPATPANIGSLPGTVPDGKLGSIGEAEYANLTPEQQEKWLRGEL